MGWIVWFGVLLMGAPFPAMILVFDEVKKLKAAGFPLEYVMTLALISLLTIFGGVVLLSRLLSPVVKTYLQSGGVVESKKPELSERPPAQIEAAREPAVSVTESATRAFEPAYREPKTH